MAKIIGTLADIRRGGLNMFAATKSRLLKFRFESVVSDILANRRSAKITYQKPDHPLTTRIVYPYVYGLTKAGNPAIRCYQWVGQTATELGWKLFRLDRLSSIEPYEYLPPQAPPLYNNSGDGGMSVIYAQAAGYVPYEERETPVYQPTDTSTIIPPIPKSYKPKAKAKPRKKQTRKSQPRK